MIKIDEEVEPVIRIPIELREYVELEEGKLEIVKPVPQDLQPLVIELQEIYRKKAGSHRSSGVQEVGGMSEPRMRYEDNLHHYALQQEIASLERHIHHDIDNWEMDMSKDLLDELKDLEKKCRSVNQRMKKDIARNS